MIVSLSLLDLQLLFMALVLKLLQPLLALVLHPQSVLFLLELHLALLDGLHSLVLFQFDLHHLLLELLTGLAKY